MAKRNEIDPEEFDGDGGPFSEITVTLQIRVLDTKVSRSLFAVSTRVDRALGKLARKRSEGGRIEVSEYGNLDVWLPGSSDQISGGFPRFDCGLGDSYETQTTAAMNESVAEAVEWVLRLHADGLKAAGKGAVRNPNQETVH